MWSDYIGIPFKDHGRERDGCDCWGFVRLIQKEVYGHDLPDLSGYDNARDVANIGLIYDMERLNWSSVSDPMPGDVIMFKIGGRPCHVGMVISAGEMLHCQRGTESCLERYDGPRWKNRISGIFRRL